MEPARARASSSAPALRAGRATRVVARRAMIPRMELPRDVTLARVEKDFPLAFLVGRWLEPGELPAGYLENDIDPSVRAAYAAIFDQMCFIALLDDGSHLALWRYHADVPLDAAPVVTLDTEGTLACAAASFADCMLEQAEEDADALRAWYLARGIPVAETAELARGRARFFPNPDERHRALETGGAPATSFREDDPRSIEDLLGMRAADPRVVEMLARVEAPELPLQLWTDGDGRLTTLYLEKARLRARVEARGVAVGDPVAALAVLGAPSKTGSRWSAWDDTRMRLHVQVRGDHVSMITLMTRDHAPG